MKALFFDETQNRLRTGWRLLAFVFIFTFLNIVASLVRRFVFHSPPMDSIEGTVVFGVLLLFSATCAVYISRRLFDKKSFQSLGLQIDQTSMVDFFVGFILSGLMVCIMYMAFVSFGWLSLQKVDWQDSSIAAWGRLFLLLIGVGITIGWWEEIVFRGYILQNLKDGVGINWAIGLSCLLYGSIHFLNPNANILSIFVIAFIGYLRIFGWLRTRQLWLSMGMHASWNFFQGPIFGFSVSGRETYSVLVNAIQGPAWITGKDFGPEGGLVAFAVSLLGIIAISLYTRSRKQPVSS